MVQHLSVRIPWHDNGWKGTVCQQPDLNQACRVLKNIAESKNDNAEQICAGQTFSIKDDYIPPCLREGGTFMSDFSIDTLPIQHPYDYDRHFKHIDHTPYRIKQAPSSAFPRVAKPFRP